VNQEIAVVFYACSAFMAISAHFLSCSPGQWLMRFFAFS